MKQLVFASRRSLAPLFARVLLGLVIFPHGAQKLFGWFGGFGFAGSMDYFTGSVGLPWIMGLLVILIEFFGALFLIVGFATRISAVAMFVVMAGIVVTQMHDYLFMNWFGANKSEGAEFFLLAMGLSLSLVVSGSGRFAVDRLIAGGEENYRLGGASLPARDFSIGDRRA